MKHILSYSGGLGSFAAACRLVEWYGKENVVLVFADTLIEDPDLYRFLRETTEYLGCEFHWLQDGRTPWEVFKDERYEGNSYAAPCSKILKTRQVDNWVKKRYNPDTCHRHLGIDATEEHRLTRAQKAMYPYVVRAPLCEEPVFLKDDVYRILKEIQIEVPQLYKDGFPHNNCGGFCVRTGQAQMVNLLEIYPERYHWHEEQQIKLHEEVPGARPFLRKTFNKELKYITLKEFREHLEDNPEDFDKYSWGGCGCFIDE